jgi:hypothetical protein
VFPCPSRFLSRMASHPLHRLVSIGVGPFLAALALVLLPVASAQAAGGTCSSSGLTQPFAKWGDTNYYELVPQGSFEGSTSAWTLSGGAHRVSGSEPYGVTGAVGEWSLALPTGASAQSLYMCVSSERSSFRLFARNMNVLSTVLVQVVYKTVLGPIPIPVGAVVLSGSWKPTQSMTTQQPVGCLLSGGCTQAALRFTAVTGESRIDDVFIDPRMR